MHNGFKFNLFDFSINVYFFSFSSSSIEGNVEDEMVEDDGPLMSSFCSGYDVANSSTTFSSRTNTPHSEMLDVSATENVIN